MPHLLLAVKARGIASVVNGIGNSSLNAFRELLLELLGNDRSLTTALGVRLVRGLAGLRAGRVDLT
jgi:hypothetical protein